MGLTINSGCWYFRLPVIKPMCEFVLFDQSTVFSCSRKNKFETQNDEAPSWWSHCFTPETFSKIQPLGWSNQVSSRTSDTWRGIVMHTLFITWHFLLPLLSQMGLYCMCKLLSAWRLEKITQQLLHGKEVKISSLAFQYFRNLSQSSEIHRDMTYRFQQLLICAFIPVLKYTSQNDQS